MKISLLFPVYNEENNLEELLRQLKEVVLKLDRFQFEFIFIDDCSTDQSPQILKKLCEEDKRIRVIRLARNCGSQAAVSAGLNECHGDCAIVMAADLQDPPELIEQFSDQWQKHVQIVWAVRSQRLGEMT